MKNLRKPYLSMFLAFLVLFVSCNQDETTDLMTEQSFNYSAFNEFKNAPSFGNIIKNLQKDSVKNKTGNTVLDTNKAILTYVNSELGTKLQLPDLALQLNDYTSDQILNIALENNWMTKKDVALTNSFITDIETFDLEKAIKNYEQATINMSLTTEEFAKKNTFINMIKSIDNLQPNLFKSSFLNKSSLAKNWFHCAAASVALAAAIAGTTSCVTVIACGVAMICLYAASRSFASNCLEE